MTMTYKEGPAMKKVKYIMAAIMAAAISSCAEKIEEPTPGASRNDYVAPVEGATFSLVASSSEDNDAPTKALFDGNQLVWNSGDALNVFASSGVIMAYDIIMTTSPICAFLAAAPFRQITPLPAGPLIT